MSKVVHNQMRSSMPTTTAKIGMRSSMHTKTARSVCSAARFLGKARSGYGQVGRLRARAALTQ
eukprot:1822029-Pleurochrysis_carterae.AAC.2